MENKKVLIKFSWEALAWDNKSWLSPEVLLDMAKKIKEIKDSWIKVALVIWAWNFIRWSEVSWWNILRTTADNMWMLWIIINWLALRDNFKAIWLDVSIYSSIQIDWIVSKFDAEKAKEDLEKGKVVICVWWTWNPYFSTDTTSVLRALELWCESVIKATQVDWLYDKDPNKFDDAKFIKEASYDDVLEKWLKVMDQTAFALARDQKLKIRIVSFAKKSAVIDALSWKDEWSLIY